MAKIKKTTKIKQDIQGIQIGKSGITDSLITEIKAQVNKHRILKVKVLKSARGEVDRKEIARDVAERVGANLVDVRGNTFTLAKK